MNVVIITSVCNIPNLPFTYSKTRSVFTHKQRYEQLKKTIQSIKQHIPNFYIILVEYSNFTDEQTNYLNSVCNTLINPKRNTECDGYVYSKYKGLGELYQTRLALHYIHKNNIDVINMFKISGRYHYSDEFKFGIYDNDLMNFQKIQNKISNISTTGYKISKKYIQKFSDYINNINCKEEIINLHGSYEKFIGKYVIQNIENIIFLNKIYITGYITNGKKYNH